MTVRLNCAPGTNRWGRHRKRLHYACAAWVLLLNCSTHLQAQDVLARNLYSVPGLIDMPSARMTADGELSAGLSFFKNTQHYVLNFQATPWLETSFRYSGLQNFDPAYPVYYDRAFAVKVRLWEEGDVLPSVAVGVNDLVGTGIYAGEYVVASKQFGNVDASIGIGWGRLGSTAQFRNPFTYLSKSFGNRVSYPNLAPGGTSVQFFRGPSSSIFGGVTWHTPLEGLSLTAEYSSDDYDLENIRGTFRPRSQINLGAAYAISDIASVGLAWMYGSSIGGHLTFRTDPRPDPYPQRMGATPPEPKVRTPEEQNASLANIMAGRNGLQRARIGDSALVDALWGLGAVNDVTLSGTQMSLFLTEGDAQATCAASAKLAEQYAVSIERISVSVRGRVASCGVTMPPLVWHDTVLRNFPTVQKPGEAPGFGVLLIDGRSPSQSSRQASAAGLRKSIQAQQISVSAIDLSGSVATIYYENSRYFSERDVLNRIVRVLMAEAPPAIEEFHMISMEAGQPVREFDFLRAAAEREYLQTGLLDLPAQISAHGAPMTNAALTRAIAPSYPRFNWSIFPQFRQQLFDPNNPFGVQLLIGAAAGIELFPGFVLHGEVEASIYDDFPLGRASDSVLPHVKTDFLTYFTNGKNGIGFLEGEYSFRLSPTVCGKLRAGYIESMFAGAGGEVLWRPDGQRWALGVDAYEVKQREFDRLFGFRPYQTFTGHISLYYASPWYNLNFAVRAGQYLAGDHGVTFEASRRFASGVEIGAFFTKTNVSADRFGEGSFDKGITIRFPLGYALPINTQNQFSMSIRPVQRDGGQRLDTDVSLYEQTRRTSDAEMATIGN